MEIGSNVWDLLSTAMVFVIGLYASVLIGRRLGAADKRAVILYVWHTLFCVVYFLYTLENEADSNVYYSQSLSGVDNFSLGSAAVTYLTALLSSTLGLSILATFLVFNVFGTVGLLAFDASLRSVTSNKHLQVRRLATFFVFLPSVSFWSSAIGKDSLAFMATSLALWAILDLNRRALLLVASVSVMLLVRPHVSALMVMAILASMMVQSRVGVWRRLSLGFGTILCALIVLPLAIDYSGLDSVAGSADLFEYIEQRQGYNMHGGGAIDISAMSLPLQMFTYLFRPLPFEAHSLSAFAASIENLALIFLLIFGIGQRLKWRPLPAQVDWVFLAVFSVSTWVLLASTTANLGIAVRQKWMFLPMIVLLAVSVIGKKRVPVSRPAHSLLVGLEDSAHQDRS